MRYAGYVLGGLGALLAATFLLGFWYTIDDGVRGVYLRNGAQVGPVIQPGLGFKFPIIDRVVKLSVRPITIQWDKVATYSKDRQPAEMQVSVTYSILPGEANGYYRTFGADENAVVGRVIGPTMQRELKNVFGAFNAEDAISKRTQLNMLVEDALRTALASRSIAIEAVNIENIDFSDAYEKAIEARMEAEVAVAKERQLLETAKVKADITVATAGAAAEATRLQGQAEADAIAARGKAIRENPGLVELVQAEKWNGVLPQTMIPGGAVPMLTLPARTTP